MKKYVSEFLSKYWFPCMMVSLALALTFALADAIQHKNELSKACIANGTMLITIDGTYYCVQPGILAPAEAN